MVPPARRRGRWSVTLIFGLLGAFFAALAVRDAEEALALRQRGVVASATVLDVRDEGRSEHVTLDFTTTQGRRTRTVVSSDHFPSAREGRTIRVVYDPRRPEVVREESRRGAWGLSVIFATGSLAMLVPAAYVALRGTPRWLRR